MYIEIWLLVAVSLIITICTAVMMVVIISQDKDLTDCYRFIANIGQMATFVEETSIERIDNSRV